MSMSKNARDEHPSTYVVQDRSNKEEMNRLRMQDEMATTSMGGVLPEHADPTHLESVLDIGCGTGGWLIQVARTYPNIARLVGVDVSQKMLDYARAQAAASKESRRADFQVMDILRKLDFADASFDLINQRFAMTYLRTWDWANVLSEHQRVVRPGGIIRLTECNIPVSNSSALNRCNDLIIEALTQAGHFSSPERDNVINGLAARLQQAGMRDIQTRLYTIDYRAGTPQGQIFIEDGKHILRTFQPFLRKWTRVPEDYDTLCQQAIYDMQQPDFAGTWKLLTAWGTTAPLATWSTTTIG